jgi:hypothetical protein
VDTKSTLDEKAMLAFLQTKWGGNPSCPMCSARQWIVQNSAFQLMQYTPGVGLSLGGPVIPVVPVICGNCGNTVLINAIMSGVVPASPPGGIPVPPEKTP